MLGPGAPCGVAAQDGSCREPSKVQRVETVTTRLRNRPYTCKPPLKPSYPATTAHSGIAAPPAVGEFTTSSFAPCGQPKGGESCFYRSCRTHWQLRPMGTTCAASRAATPRTPTILGAALLLLHLGR